MQFLLCLLSKTFISVKKHYPIAGSLFYGIVLGSGKIVHPPEVFHTCACRLSNSHRSICRSRVHHHKLIRNPYITGRASYFGPTKLKVSIVVPIRVNRKKEVRYE